MSEMPETVWLEPVQADMPNGGWYADVQKSEYFNGVEKYHHDRIVQAKDARIAELEAQLKECVVELKKRLDEVEVKLPATPLVFKNALSVMEKMAELIKDARPLVTDRSSRGELTQALTLYEKFKADIASAEGV